MFGRRLQKARGGEGIAAKARSGRAVASEKSYHEQSRQPAGPSLSLALTLLAVLGAFLAMGIGCTTSRETRGLTDGQTEDFFSKIRPNSGDTSRLMQNALYYRLMARPQLALKELEEAHALDPDNLKIVNTLANCYEELGDFPRAQKLYQEALSRHGDNAALHNNLCFSYYLAGRWEQAEACFKEALARDPGNQAARNNLGLLYCRLGKPQEARRLWQEAEGEAAAEQKVNLVLAALGVSAPAAYAQAPGARQPGAPVRPPTEARPAAPGTKAQAPGSPAESPAKPREVAAAPAAAPPSKPAAEIPAKTHQPSPGAAVQAPAPPAAPLAKPMEIAAKPAAPPPAATAPATAAAPKPGSATVKNNKGLAPEVSKPAGEAKATSPAGNLPQAGPKYLTSAELVETAIEVRNGTWTHNLAHHTRTALSAKGFNVTIIGNHIDFGAERTLVYYRPGAERVARFLAKDFFPTSLIEESQKLRGGVDVKIILGYDLTKSPELMARLGEGEED